MKKMLINFFRKPSNVCSLIGVSTGIIITFIIYYSLGVFNPPSEEDFSGLHKQEELIIQDFDNIYALENASISMNGNEIVVKLVSEKDSSYSIKMMFSKDKQFISSQEISDKPGYKTYPVDKKIDKITPYVLVTAIGVFLGALFSLIIDVIYKIIIIIRIKKK